jgi:hypothetical protein
MIGSYDRMAFGVNCYYLACSDKLLLYYFGLAWVGVFYHVFIVELSMGDVKGKLNAWL